MSKGDAHYSGWNSPYRVGFPRHQEIPENGRAQWMPWTLRISLWDIGTHSFVVGGMWLLVTHREGLVQEFSKESSLTSGYSLSQRQLHLMTGIYKGTKAMSH